MLRRLLALFAAMAGMALWAPQSAAKANEVSPALPCDLQAFCAVTRASDPKTPVFKTTKAASAAHFIDTIGIGGTADEASAQKLAYLGIRHLRTSTNRAASLLAAGARGARMDVIVPWYLRPMTSVDLENLVAQLEPAASVIEAIEGPNEVNHYPVRYDGLTGVAAIQAQQRKLYALVKENRALNGTKQSTAVYNFTVLQGTPASTYGDMSQYADIMNVHAYGGPGIPPSWVFPFETARYRITGKPLAMTETGATTIASAKGVSEVMQARYDIKALLDAYRLNVWRTYIFNLQDWAAEADTRDFSAHYGLYKIDGGIKLAGTALHNFIRILSDTMLDSDEGDDTLRYSLSGLPSYGRAQLFSKSNGTFELVLWNETMDWNPAARSEIPVATGKITLFAAGEFQKMAIYDPILSDRPVAEVSNAGGVTFPLGNDPVIVELVPKGKPDRQTAH